MQGRTSDPFFCTPGVCHLTEFGNRRITPHGTANPFNDFIIHLRATFLCQSIFGLLKLTFETLSKLTLHRTFFQLFSRRVYLQIIVASFFMLNFPQADLTLSTEAFDRIQKGSNREIFSAHTQRKHMKVIRRKYYRM
jgi:hypothetical protein